MSLYDKYLRRLPISEQDWADAVDDYRQASADELHSMLRARSDDWKRTVDLHPGLRPDRFNGCHPEEQRLQMIEMEINLIRAVLAEKGIPSPVSHDVTDFVERIAPLAITPDTPATVPASRSGPKGNPELNSRIVTVINRFASELARALAGDLRSARHREGAPSPGLKKWTEAGSTTWLDVLDTDREGLVKALDHRVRRTSHR